MLVFNNEKIYFKDKIIEWRSTTSCNGCCFFRPQRICYCRIDRMLYDCGRYGVCSGMFIEI